MREIPFVVSFNSRVAILQRLIASDKIKVQGEYQGYLQGPSIQIAVRRTHIYEDSFDKLRPENGAFHLTIVGRIYFDNNSYYRTRFETQIPRSNG